MEGNGLIWAFRGFGDWRELETWGTGIGSSGGRGEGMLGDRGGVEDLGVSSSADICRSPNLSSCIYIYIY